MFTLGVQLCVQRDGRLCVRQRRAGLSASADILVTRDVSSSLCVCVCLSHAGIVSKQLHESSWILAYSLTLIYLTLHFQENRVSKNRGTSIWNFVPNSGLGHGTSTVAECDK